MSSIVLPYINVLGVKINAISMDSAIRSIARWIKDRHKVYCNVCAVHTIMECQRNEMLRSIVNNSDLSTPDGMPLVWLAHHYGFREATRVYGPDLMLSVCEQSQRRGYRHFFYGGKPGVVDQLCENLKNRYPALEVAGSYSPPLRNVGYLEEPGVIRCINDASADIVWVGLGTPKQDFWVAQHRKHLNAPVLVAVGAAFDFHAGIIRQAPKWVQESGLEWAFRLMQEPRRLAHRYLIYNPLFILLTFMQLSGLRKYGNTFENNDVCV
jgi:N-acetylglucosaminyldiphosphoundecaprenol N-acetyl-beta-D-mannosaminyltransferase